MLMCSFVNRDSTMLLCCICCGGSISTNVGLFFAASLPPALSSGKPSRVRSYFSHQLSYRKLYLKTGGWYL